MSQSSTVFNLVKAIARSRSWSFLLFDLHTALSMCSDLWPRSCDITSVWFSAKTNSTIMLQVVDTRVLLIHRRALLWEKSCCYQLMCHKKARQVIRTILNFLMTHQHSNTLYGRYIQMTHEECFFFPGACHFYFIKIHYKMTHSTVGSKSIQPPWHIPITAIVNKSCNIVCCVYNSNISNHPKYDFFKV